MDFAGIYAPFVLFFEGEIIILKSYGGQTGIEIIPYHNHIRGNGAEIFLIDGGMMKMQIVRIDFSPEKM